MNAKLQVIAGTFREQGYTMYAVGLDLLFINERGNTVIAFFMDRVFIESMAGDSRAGVYDARSYDRPKDGDLIALIKQIYTTLSGFPVSFCKQIPPDVNVYDIDTWIAENVASGFDLENEPEISSFMAIKGIIKGYTRLIPAPLNPVVNMVQMFSTKNKAFRLYKLTENTYLIDILQR